MKQQLTAFCIVLLALLAAGCAQRADEKTNERTAEAASSAPRLETEQPLRVSAEDADAAEPAVAAGRDGVAFVVWVEHRGKGTADVMLARFGKDGQSPGQPVRVNPRAGEAKAWHGDPPTLAVASDGTIYVGWTARDGATGHANTLYLSASRDGGRSFAPPVKVNDDEKPASHGMHSLTVAADGRIHLAWLDERNVAPLPKPPAGAAHAHAEPNGEVFTAFSTDGGRTFSPNRLVARDACPCCKTSLAAGAAGRVHVGWRQVLPGDFRHIAVASSSDGGQTFAPPVVVSDDRWKLTACPVSGAALAVAADGALRVLWYAAGEAGEPGLYWSESRDNGKSFAPRRFFAASSGRGMPVLLENGAGHFVAVWEGSDGGNAKTMAAQLESVERGAASVGVLSAGELPAATATNTQALVAYTSKVGERRGVWIMPARLLKQ